MKIEDYVFASIDAYSRNEQEHSLLHACIAIDATSQKRENLSHAKRSAFIQLIRDYYWILEPMTGAGINFDETIWNNIIAHNERGQLVENLDIASFIYYLFRCTQAHGQEIPHRYKLVKRDGNNNLEYHIANDQLNIPETIIFGLLAICVFSKINLDIKTSTKHWLSLGENRFHIGNWWGMEDSFRPIAKKFNEVRVTLQGLNFSDATAKDIMELIVKQPS